MNNWEGGDTDADGRGAPGAPRHTRGHRATCVRRCSSAAHPRRDRGAGGIRGNAFISGGFLAPSVRGTTYEGLVTVWDWYAVSAPCVAARDAVGGPGIVTSVDIRMATAVPNGVLTLGPV
jgi:hypothetical protein